MDYTPFTTTTVHALAAPHKPSIIEIKMGFMESGWGWTMNFTFPARIGGAFVAFYWRMMHFGWQGATVLSN